MILSNKRIKKVMLMFPNQQWYKYDLTTTWNLSPYALCLIGGMLKEYGFDVKVVDCQFYGMTEEQFKKEVEDYHPDVVGISQLTSEYAATAYRAAEITKEVDRSITTVLGGVHVTTQHEKVMEQKSIDYGIRGEGEYVFRDFLKYLNGEGPMPAKGLIYRDENGKVVALCSDLIQDLDVLPRPDYSLVDFNAYINTGPRYGVDTVHIFPYARILTSRGCPVGCSFCQVESISGAKWRYHSAQRVADDVEWLVKDYGIKAFIFEDDNVFGTKRRTKEMLRLIKERNLNLKWKAAGITVFTLDEEIVQLMSETGCLMIGIAIETGTKRIMKEVIRKPVDLDQVPKMVEVLHKYGIYVAANFIIGFPGETWDEIRQTLHYAEHCGVDYAKVYIAQPLIGTKLYDMAVGMDAIVGDHYAVGWRYGRIKSNEFSPKDISILRVYEWDRINFADPQKRARTAEIMGITEEKLKQIREATRNKLTFEDMDLTTIDDRLSNAVPKEEKVRPTARINTYTLKTEEQQADEKVANFSE